MLKDKYVFAQLVKSLDNDKFRHLVDKYDGDKYVKSYTWWNQLLTLMFGQLSNRESLCDLIVAMEAHAGKLYHLGIGKVILARLTSNAISAIITYCLVAIVQHYMKLERSIYEVLQILGISLTDKTHLRDLFDKSNFKNVNVLYGSSEPNLFNFNPVHF